MNDLDCKTVEFIYGLSVIGFFVFRAYMDVKELKEVLNLDGSTHLNIFFANSTDEDLAGVATWPWDKEALTHLGKTTVHGYAFNFVLQSNT